MNPTVHVIENVYGKVHFPVKYALRPYVLYHVVLRNKHEAKPVQCALH